jgi:hypothetical protein
MHSGMGCKSAKRSNHCQTKAAKKHPDNSLYLGRSKKGSWFHIIIIIMPDNIVAD